MTTHPDPFAPTFVVEREHAARRRRAAEEHLARRLEGLRRLRRSDG